MATQQPRPEEGTPGFKLWDQGHKIGYQEGRTETLTMFIQWLMDRYMKPELEMDSPEGLAIKELLTASGKFLRGDLG